MFLGGVEPTKDLKGEIDFCGVKFFYPTRVETMVVNNLDLIVPAGSVTSVVGRSGSGKSTLGLLLLGLYRPTAGEVRVDGIPVSQYNPVWLRSRIGTVSQVVTLLDLNYS